MEESYNTLKKEERKIMNDELYPIAMEKYPIEIAQVQVPVEECEEPVPTPAPIPTPMPAPIPQPAVPAGDYVEYIVKPGDSLWKISQMYGTTIDAIKQLSGLTSDYLSIGQKLKVPKA